MSNVNGAPDRSRGIETHRVAVVGKCVTEPSQDVLVMNDVSLLLTLT